MLLGWNDELMDWADQERLVRQDVAELERKIRQRKAEAYRRAEDGEDERINPEN